MTNVSRRARKASGPLLWVVLAATAVAVASVVVLRASENDGAAAGAGPPRFTDVTEQVGIPTTHTLSWGALFADYNRSGYPDLFVNRHFWRPWLLENRAGRRFVAHDEDFYPKRVDRHNCAWGEATGNGRADLYCVAGALMGEGRDPNQLFLQQRDGDFRNVARRFGVGYAPGRGRTMHWMDYDGDGDLDLVVTNAPREGFPNVLFRNDGAGFTRTRAGIEDYLRTSESAWADWNRNGYPDLLIAQHHAEPIVAYENKGGGFERVELPGVTDLRDRWLAVTWGDFDGDGWPDLHLVGHTRAVVLRNVEGRRFEVIDDRPLQRGRMSVWLDVNNNGRLDLFVVQGADSSDRDSVNQPNFFLIQSRAGRFEKVEHRSFRGPRIGNGDSVAAADFDRDGRVDLFVSNGHRPRWWRGPSTLLRNTTDALNWAGVELRGPPQNPWGFGARVKVEGSDVDYWRYVNDGVSGRSQSEVGFLHLGLATSPRAEVRVEWPGGQADCITVAANAIATLPIGSSPCPRM